MNRSLAVGAALLALLSGCPLPQPLPSYPPGTVTPPRILMDEISSPAAAILVPAGCTTAPSYDLTASLVDDNTSETISVRWFVDYDRQNSARCVPAVFPQENIPGPGDSAPNPTVRAVQPYSFLPYDHAPVMGGSDSRGPGVVHVVEMVVSNGFDTNQDHQELCVPSPSESAATLQLPFRTPASLGNVRFETQTYRWVFLNVPQSADVPCPSP